MFTVVKTLGTVKGKYIVEAVCLSEDEKPIKYGNGSKCKEMDTSKRYLFDEAGAMWREWREASY